MNGNKIFVDTNIILYFLKGEKEVVEMISDKELVISFVTELELLSFPEISADAVKVIKGLLRNCQIININQDIKNLTIRLRKKYKLKLPDAIIGATALFQKLPLITADKQFRKIEELDVIEYDV